MKRLSCSRLISWMWTVTWEFLIAKHRCYFSISWCIFFYDLMHGTIPINLPNPGSINLEDWVCAPKILWHNGINITPHNNFDTEIHDVLISNKKVLNTHYIHSKWNYKTRINIYYIYHTYVELIVVGNIDLYLTRIHDFFSLVRDFRLWLENRKLILPRKMLLLVEIIWYIWI